MPSNVAGAASPASLASARFASAAARWTCPASSADPAGTPPPPPPPAAPEERAARVVRDRDLAAARRCIVKPPRRDAPRRPRRLGRSSSFFVAPPPPAAVVAKARFAAPSLAATETAAFQEPRRTPALSPSPPLALALALVRQLVRNLALDRVDDRDEVAPRSARFRFRSASSALVFRLLRPELNEALTFSRVLKRFDVRISTRWSAE